jgi:hypothetical protein
VAEPTVCEEACLNLIGWGNVVRSEAHAEALASVLVYGGWWVSVTDGMMQQQHMWS